MAPADHDPIWKDRAQEWIGAQSRAENGVARNRVGVCHPAGLAFRQTKCVHEGFYRGAFLLRVDHHLWPEGLHLFWGEGLAFGQLQDGIQVYLGKPCCADCAELAARSLDPKRLVAGECAGVAFPQDRQCALLAPQFV